MSLLSKILKGSRAAFTASAEFEIWRLLFNNTGLLLIEERNRSTKEVQYAIVDTGTKKEIRPRWSPEDGFWTGIEAFHDSIILFHGYEKPDMPGHKGLTARSSIDGSLLWQLSDVRFLFCFEGLVYCSTEQAGARAYKSVSLASGTIVHNYAEDAAEVMKIRDRYIQETFSDFLYPEPLHEQIKTLFLSKGVLFPDIRPDTPIEYILYQEKVILAYYQNDFSQLLTQVLSVYDFSGKVSVQKFVLNSNVERFVADSFFVLGPQLYLLTEKKQLYILKLE